jgi:glutathione synthase
MRFLYVMDPMERLLPSKDTTVAMQSATQARGHTSLHCEPRDVFIHGGEVFAKARPVTVDTSKSSWFTYGESCVVGLGDLAAVFIRKDPPFDAAYLYLTHLLEVARGKTLLINDPAGLRNANEKLYTLHFAEFMPQTLVTADRDRIHQFVIDVGGEAVVKPLDGAGGAGVMRLRTNDDNRRSIVDTLTQEGRVLVMVQQYVPAVRSGDKRILLLDGEILGAINRVPRSDDLRSNIHAGGRVEAIEVTDGERAMVASMAARLRNDGLFFVGLDVIGDRLTEVNVTSPTGIQELSQHMGREVAQDVIAWAERRASGA